MKPQEKKIRRILDELVARSVESEPARSPAPSAAPRFCVNAEDVSFLKSIGIDPTRTVRRRRKPRFSV